MKIVQVSDIHIRNLKFHQDYRKVFDDFYRQLDIIRPNLVVNTGDTAHTKTTISPEFVDMAKDFFREVSKRCPIINVLGNHDLNLMNEDRQDAITPIIQALRSDDIVLLKKSGVYVPGWDLHRRYRFWNFGISDVENWPRPPYDEDYINIGLFHGTIRNAITDSDFVMTQVEYDEDIFKGLDFVMMGDIHKRQFFNGGRYWYAGSMIQQNFGEDLDKGFLVWDIKDKDDYHVDFVELKGNRRFYTIRLMDNLSVPEDMYIEEGSRVRIAPPRQLTLVEQKGVEKLVKKKFNPHDVITLAANNIGQQSVDAAQFEERVENLRRLDVQERLLREFLALKKLDEQTFQKIIDINRKYQVAVEQKDDVSRGVNWKVLKMGWNNLYNYGSGNVVDFSQMKGLTGIFAPNASGKSGLIDVITVGMFDCNTKEVAKNVHLINDNKDNALAILELMANGERYTIQRNIERVKFGQRKGDEGEWGKTSLEFVRNDKDGGIESLNGETRPQTEANIKRRFGAFDDFMLTSLFAQWDPMDLIMCKETDRKRILFRFLDLDIFEDKAKMAKDEVKKWNEKLKILEDGDYESVAFNLKVEIAQLNESISDTEKKIVDNTKSEEDIRNEIATLLSSKHQIAHSGDRDTVAKKIGNLKQLAEKYKNDLELDESRKKWMIDERVMKLEQISKFDEEKIKKETKKNSELTKELSSLMSLLKDHKKHVYDGEHQTEILDNVPCGDRFPTCRFLIEAFKARANLPAHREEVAEILEDIDVVKHGIDETIGAWEDSENLERLKKEISEIDVDKIDLAIENKRLMIARAMDQITENEEVLNEIEKSIDDVKKNREIDEQVKMLKSQESVISRHTTSLRSTLSDLHKKLGANEGVLEKIENALKEIENVRITCSAYEHYMNAMGKDGIALGILRQKLPHVNQEINRILSQAAEFGAYIEYNEKEQSIGLYIQYGSYKSRLLELGSGAEKFISSVAIRSALLSISNLPRSNLFIVDEGFGKLDPQNLEAVGKMFDYLKTQFEHVIVISHLDVMKDMMDNIIEISSDEEGYAHVCVGE